MFDLASYALGVATPFVTLGVGLYAAHRYDKTRARERRVLRQAADALEPYAHLVETVDGTTIVKPASITMDDHRRALAVRNDLAGML